MGKRKKDIFLSGGAGERERDQENDKELKRAYLFKLLALLVFAGILVTFTTIAWFTMNKDVGTGGMSISTVGELFTIEPLSPPAHAGIYDDENVGTYVRDKLMDEAGIDSDIITWTITDDVAVTDPDTNKTTVTPGYNIGNGPATGFDGGISPGSSGEIRFIVKPNQPVAAEFTFFIYAYSGGYDSNGDEDKSTISIITSSSDDAELLANSLLNGHLLLFQNKDNDGKYSGLIEPDSTNAMKRIMSGNYSAQTTVSIYWIWPETLAEIMLDESDSTHLRKLRGKRNSCNSTGKAELIALFRSHPEWFLLDPENSDRDWSSEFDSSYADSAIINLINRDYGLYSSYYNEADQHIGTYISYLFLNLTAAGTGTGGSGPGSGE